MLQKSESIDGQNPINAVLEESKAKRDTLSDDILKNPIKSGINALIHLF
mgnify:CR=1 FL=1